jgi:hypothetical protein
MFVSSEYSPEELNLYNPAYVGTLLYHATREYQTKDSSGLPCTLAYIIAPMSLSPRYSSILPATTATPIAGWVADHEGELIGFSEAINAYADIVNSAIVFLLHQEAILLDDDGRYHLQNDKLAQKPVLINKNKNFKESFLAAGLLGRWFAEASSIESIYTQLGVRP